MSKAVFGKNSNHPVLFFDVLVVVMMGGRVFFFVVVFVGITVFPSNKSKRISKHRAGAIETA